MYVFSHFSTWLRISRVPNSLLANMSTTAHFIDRASSLCWPFRLCLYAFSFCQWSCHESCSPCSTIWLGMRFSIQAHCQHCSLGSSVFWHFRIFPYMFDGHSMLTIFSLYLHVLFHWTRFAKGSSLCSCILKSPECGSEWTQIRYVMFLYAVFHGFSVHLMHGLTLVYIVGSRI